MIKVTRPPADNSKISHKNEFESCYLRHRYIRKTTHNPTPREMAPYESIAINMAKNTFFTYRTLFGMVGFESEDLANTNRAHLISFLGLFSLESSSDKLKTFESLFYRINKRYPNDKDILNKNKANFTMFLKQRMEDVVRVCRQKTKNIKGLSAEEFYVFYGTNAPPANLSKLLENHNKLGFKKLDIASFKSIKKKAKHRSDTPFKFGSKWYCAIPLGNKSLTLSDLTGNDMNPRDNIIGMNPLQILAENEENNFWDKKQTLFNSYSKEEKVFAIKDFLLKNVNNNKYITEVKIAKKNLRLLNKTKD